MIRIHGFDLKSKMVINHETLIEFNLEIIQLLNTFLDYINCFKKHKMYQKVETELKRVNSEQPTSGIVAAF